MKTLSKLALGITAAVTLTVTQTHAVIYFQDDFSYANGALTNVSAGNWGSFSGSSSVNVSNGYAIVAGDRTQDVAAQLGSVHSNDIFYAKYDFRFDVLPGASNATSYFMMFKDAGTSLFLGRTLGATNIAGSAAGTFRLGVNADSAGAPKAVFPTDLSLGTWHTAVIKVDQTAVSAPVVTLWVDPTLESDPSVSHSSTLANLAISTIALRQASTIGRVNIDNLVVGSSFSEVIPEPSTMLLVSVGLAGILALRRRK